MSQKSKKNGGGKTVAKKKRRIKHGEKREKQSARIKELRNRTTVIQQRGKATALIQPKCDFALYVGTSFPATTTTKNTRQRQRVYGGRTLLSQLPKG